MITDVSIDPAGNVWAGNKNWWLGPSVVVLHLALPGRLLPHQRADPDHRLEGGQRPAVDPLGGGVGKIFHLGKLPVNTQLSAYYNVVRPDYQANWQIRAQVQLMFPK